MRWKSLIARRATYVYKNLAGHPMKTPIGVYKEGKRPSYRGINGE
jgi:hypothetical protein